MAKAQKTDRYQIPQSYKDTAAKLQAAGRFNVGTPLYGNGKKKRK